MSLHTERPVLSFMTANYVAATLGYPGTGDWGPYDDATNDAFAPLETFDERFDQLLATVATAGFDAVDLWVAHLNWRWATPAHVTRARAALAAHELRVVSLAGNFGSSPDELAAACRLANELGTTVLGGMGDVLHSDRPAAEAVLREHGVRFALENHAERTPDAVLDTIGSADVIGVAIDTGWWATQGYDPVQAIAELEDRIFHVHLKDIERAGEHVTCAHGAGIVDIVGCVDALLSSGYEGAFSIEHEPYDRDPTVECIAMREGLETRFEAASHR